MAAGTLKVVVSLLALGMILGGNVLPYARTYGEQPASSTVLMSSILTGGQGDSIQRDPITITAAAAPGQTSPTQVVITSPAEPETKSVSYTKNSVAPKQLFMLRLESLTVTEGLRRYRSKIEICARIVELLRFDALSVSEVALLARINFGKAADFLSFLESRSLVSKAVRNGRSTYVATERGLRFSSTTKDAYRYLSS